MTANTLYYFAASSTQGGTTTWSPVVDFMPAAGGSFSCTSTVYAVIGSQFYSFGYSTGSSAYVFTKIGSAMATTLNGIGYDDQDNYIYGWAGSNLYKIDAAGAEHEISTSTYANVNSTGGDFIPNSSIMLTVSNSGGLAMEDVTSPTRASEPVTTASGSVSMNVYDVTLNTSGTYYVGYGMSGQTLYQLSIPVASVPLNSATWTSTTFSGVATVKSVTGVSSASPNATGTGDNFGSAISDSVGDLFFYDSTLNKMYEIPAAKVALAFPSVGTAGTGSYGSIMNYVAAPSSSPGTGSSDGAGCVNAGSAFAPSVTTTAATSLTSTSATLNGTAGANGAAITATSFLYATSAATAGGILTSSPVSVTATPTPALSGSVSQTYTLGAALSGLTPGQTYYFQAVATNADGTNYGAVLSFVAPALKSQTISFTSSIPTTPVYGGTYTATATATSSLPVTLTIDAGSSSACTINAVTGVVTFIGVGNCVIDANQPGNGSYNPALQVQQTIAVAKAPQVVAFTSSPSSTSINDTYQPVSSSGASGNPVVYSIDGSSTAGACTIDPVSYLVTFTGAGTCLVDANQAGNANYYGAAQAQQSITVGALSQTVTFTTTDPNDYVGNTYTADGSASSELLPVITVDPGSAGVCTITVAPGVVRPDSLSPAAQIVTFLGVGNCVLDINQAGNGAYNAADQVQETIVVGANPTTTTVTPDVTTTFGGATTISVQVGPSNGANNFGVSFAGGTVLVSDGAGNSCTATLDSSGNGSCTIVEPTTGSYTYTGDFAAFNGYGASEGSGSGSVTPAIAPTTTTITSVTNNGVGGNYVVYVTVVPQSPSLNTPSGTVTVTDGNGGTCSATLDENGNGSCSMLESSLGAVTIGATYGGDDNFDTSSAVSLPDEIGLAPTVTTIVTTSGAVVGQPDVITVNVAPSSTNEYVPSGTVSVTDGTATCTVTLSSNGDGTSGGSCSLTEASAATPTYTASYGGDANFDVSSGSYDETIAPADTTTTITSISGSTLGQPLTLSVHVAPVAPGSGVPTGTVTITDGKGHTCTATLNASGNGSCTITETVTGTYVFNATYNGDADYTTSATSNTTNSNNGSSVTLNKLPQRLLITTPAPTGKTPGSTYTPSVTPGISGVPVTLTAGPSSVCTIANGVVTFVGVGTCTLRATEPGNDEYSAAPTVTQTIRVAPVAPSAPLDVVATPSASGTSATITWNAPRSDGGSPITGYRIIVEPGNLVCTTNGLHHCVVTGLTPGASYSYRVVAVNVAGRSPFASALALDLEPFVNNTSTLTASMVVLLNQAAVGIKADKYHHVTMIGYASSTGTQTLNSALGAARAAVAATYLAHRLAALGVTGVTITTIGAGATNFAVADTAAAANRRTVVLIN